MLQIKLFPFDRNKRYTSSEIKTRYAEKTGLVELAVLVKKYEKSVFGGDSPEFAQLSSLQFTKPR